MSTHLIYGGVGSRDTPTHACEAMERIGVALCKRGWMLRSGGAIGADRAFQRGAEAVDRTLLEVFNAYDAVGHVWAHQDAAAHQPGWEGCNGSARLLLARNSLIVRGHDMQTHILFLVCWTERGQVIGGTGQTMRVCASAGIPIFNLWNPECEKLVLEFARLIELKM